MDDSAAGDVSCAVVRVYSGFGRMKVNTAEPFMIIRAVAPNLRDDMFRM